MADNVSMQFLLFFCLFYEEECKMSFTIVFQNEITGERITVDSDDLETFERLWDDRDWHLVKNSMESK